MPRTAIVIGAGLAGLLAAAALFPAYDEVLVLDRDELPDGPEHRRGLPQGRHAHLLMPGGLEAMEALLPPAAIRERLLSAGAHEISLGAGMVVLSTEGWFHRWRKDGQLMITCSRALLDWVVREALLATANNIRFLQGQALELIGDAQKISGIRIDTGSGPTDLDADFVVDASGRGSRIVKWLATLGITGIEERTVDSGLVNATRIYRTPPPAENFPLTMVQANPYQSLPGRSAVIVPIEDSRWMVSLAGTRGGEPPANPDSFLQYTLDLPHPIVGQLISGAEPLTDVVVSRSTSNARRYLEKARQWPDRLVVLGDALATFNPAYGQGMSVAALGAQVLGREARRNALHVPGAARTIQRAAARSVEAAWTLAVSQDVLYPEVRGGAPTLVDHLAARYTRRLTKAATGSYAAASALWTVTGLKAGPTHLLRPASLLHAITGPPLPALSAPPLTPRERQIMSALDRTSGGANPTPRPV
ncbi:FAD-dependent monooxygenase [Streptomyces sp. NPDC051639]|uniref:NAD(P)/FAD-dependent oxidoreductase n=1 Tax=Streptomyces sp. NPDC051639 TaxID=3155671 RepID=UPI0034475D8E